MSRLPPLGSVTSPPIRMSAAAPRAASKTRGRRQIDGEGAPSPSQSRSRSPQAAASAAPVPPALPLPAWSCCPLVLHPQFVSVYV
jgi:hypothetical protein